MPKRTPVCPDQLTFDLRVKWCSRCDQERPAWDFVKNKGRKDGLQVYCRTCWNAWMAQRYAKSADLRETRSGYGKEHYERNRDAIRARHKAWAAANSDRISELGRAWYRANREKSSAQSKLWYRENRERAKANHDAWRHANAERVKTARRIWKKANRDAIREKDRAWVEANRDKHRANGARRRARVAAVSMIAFTPEQLAERWSYYGNKCWVCHGAATATDHVKPIAKGGAHMLCNLRPICRTCNSAKRDKWPFSIKDAA